MSKPFEGVRVLEVAAWTFVPVAGAMLADMGADVIKVEPPTGDPQRGLQNMLNNQTRGPNPFTEIPNRGKRSITLDLRSDAGHDVLMRLAATADVFLTSYLPEVRRRLKIDVDDLRAANPDIIYARGSGWGSMGPMCNAGGYDLASAWATSGFADRLGTDRPEGPPPMPAAFFDLQGGNTIAGAIATALFKRERTGEPSVVDVSLMNVGMWALAPDIVSAPFMEPRVPDRRAPGNPITNWYQTRDGRWLYLVCLQGDRFWAEFCRVIERPDLVDDPRFADADARFENRRVCVETLDAVFATHTLEEWNDRFAGFSGVWAPALKFRELHDHEQVAANGYLPALTSNDGVDFHLVSSAMHFDETPTTPGGPAPELGQHTEMVLMGSGFEWEEIEDIRKRGGLG